MKNMRSPKKQGGWIQYVIAGAQAASSIRSSNKAKRQNKRLISENVNMINLETEENLRRMEQTFTQIKGEATARAASSGFDIKGDIKGTFKGSVAGYFEDLEQEYQGRVDWTKRVAEQKIRQIRAGGAYIGTQISAEGAQGTLNAANNAANWYHR